MIVLDLLETYEVEAAETMGRVIFELEIFNEKYDIQPCRPFTLETEM